MNAIGEATTQTTDGSSTEEARRNGTIQICSEQDIHVLLEIADKNGPTGKNDRSRVTTEYNTHAVKNDLLARDLEGLRNKFDRLAAIKNPTGGPFCPENVCEAKRISRDINNLACAATVGNSGEVEDGNSAAENGNDPTFPLIESPSFSSLFSTPVLKRNLGTGRKRRHHSHTGTRKKAINKAGFVSEDLSSKAKSVESLLNVLASSSASGIVVSSNPNPHITEVEKLQNDVNQLNTTMADLEDMMEDLLSQS